MEKSEQEQLYSLMERSFYTRLWEYIKIVIPLNIGLLLELSLVLLNLVSAGKYGGNDVTIGAISLAWTFGFLCILSLLQGLAGALDTLASQEFGAQNYENCAIYFNKTRYACLFFCILFAPLYFFSNYIFGAIGIQQDVADECGVFLRYYYFSNSFTIQAVSIRNQLRSQGHVWPHFVSSALTFVVQLLYIIITINFGEINIHSIGMANAVSGFVNFAFLYFIISFTQLVHPETYRNLKCDDLKNWSIFLKTAIPSLLLVGVEGWSYQISTLIIGTLGSLNLAAQGITGNIAGVVWIGCGFGTSMAISALVGNAIGMQKVKLARRISCEMTIISFALIAACNLALDPFPQAVLGLFTNQEAVIVKAERAFSLMMIGVIFDVLKWAGYGISKGLGVIKRLPLIQFIFYYIIHQPISIILIFVFNYQFEAYWVVLIFTAGGLALITHIMMWTQDWNKIAREVEDRGQQEKLKRLSDTDLATPLIEEEF